MSDESTMAGVRFARISARRHRRDHGTQPSLFVDRTHYGRSFWSVNDGDR